jgi:hypothetical protein
VARARARHNDARAHGGACSHLMRATAPRPWARGTPRRAWRAGQQAREQRASRRQCVSERRVVSLFWAPADDVSTRARSSDSKAACAKSK